MQSNFEEILSQHGPMLSRVASSYEANHHLQQELLQEISLAVWQSLKNFKGNSSIKTYIMRVAHNRAVNHVAYNAKQPHKESITEQHSSQNQYEMEKNIGQTDQVENLLNVVRSLPMQARQIITMSMEGLSYQEIAHVCGIQASNVGAILSRTKKHLSERIENE